MPGRQSVGAKIARHVEQIDEFDLLVAGDAGNGRLALGVGLGEGVDHLGAKPRLVIQHVMRNAEPRRHLAGVENILAGAAGARPMFRFSLVVKLHGDADDVIALLLEQGRDHGRIDAAGHGHDHAGFTRRLGQVETIAIWRRGGGHE